MYLLLLVLGCLIWVFSVVGFDLIICFGWCWWLLCCCSMVSFCGMFGLGVFLLTGFGSDLFWFIV